MGISTHISWCDATLNLWIGCTRVGPGCDHCYAERDNARYKYVPGWGPGMPRRRTSEQLWRQIKAWNKAPERVIGTQWPGRRPRLFINSYSDFFDNEVEDQWRLDGWEEQRRAQNLDFILVTKRVSNVEKMLPPHWDKQNRSNIILLITVVTRAEWDRDVPRLKALKDRYPWLRVGISMEPMLERIEPGQDIGWLDWLICGGESGGPEARPMHPDWAVHIQKACAAAKVPFHFKQHGAWIAVKSVNVTKDHGYFEGDVFHPVKRWGEVHDKLKSHVVMERVGDIAAGRVLAGTVYDEFVKAA